METKFGETTACIFLDLSDIFEHASMSIQAAIDSTLERGGGTVALSAGEFTIDKTLNLPSRVILTGQGNATVLKLADGVNAPVIQTERFESLTGSNAWFAIRESVPTAFGIHSLTIDGNWENNEDSPGVRFFGKRYTLRDVAIRKTSGVGFYSECGNQVGQDGPDDMPECIVDGLWVAMTRSHGVHFRGPHDGILNNVLVSRASGKGIFIEFKSGEFDGSCDADMWHAYACHDVGVQIDAKINTGTRITGENCGREGIVIGATRACNLAAVSSFDANNVGAMSPADRQNGFKSYNVRISTGFHSISGLRIYDRRASLGSLLVEGQQVSINGLIVDGHGSNGIGASVASGMNQISGFITRYSGESAVAVQIGNSTRLSKIDLNINDCSVALSSLGRPYGNDINLRVMMSEDQQLLDGATAVEDDDMNSMNIKFLRKN